MNSAVLFLTYRRFSTAKKVFESIRQAQPPRLYFASNAPNPDNKNEEQRVAKVRGLLDLIDWDCDVHTLFREEYLSVKYSIPSAIDWFFETEEMGVILEDDCLPSQSFYMFCDELLEKYKEDGRIWHVAGYSPYVGAGCKDEYSYYYSRFTQIWGWATWRDRWVHYDLNMSLFKKKGERLFRQYEFFCENFQNRSRALIIDRLINGEINTWDYQWNFAVRTNSGLSITPSVSLIENIGFARKDAVNTKSNRVDVALNTCNDIDFPLKVPEFCMVNSIVDKKFSLLTMGRYSSRIHRVILWLATMISTKK